MSFTKQLEKHNTVPTAIESKHGFMYLPHNSDATVYCPPDINLILENRSFEYSYYYQFKSPWNFTETQNNYVPSEWTEASKLNELIDKATHWTSIFNKAPKPSFDWPTLVLSIIMTVIIIAVGIFGFCYIRKKCIKGKPFRTFLHRRNAIRRRESTPEESSGYDDYSIQSPSATFRSNVSGDPLLTLNTGHSSRPILRSLSPTPTLSTQITGARSILRRPISPSSTSSTTITAGRSTLGRGFDF